MLYVILFRESVYFVHRCNKRFSTPKSEKAYSPSRKIEKRERNKFHELKRILTALNRRSMAHHERDMRSGSESMRSSLLWVLTVPCRYYWLVLKQIFAEMAVSLIRALGGMEDCEPLQKSIEKRICSLFW